MSATETLPSWKQVFRKGFAPKMSESALLALKAALTSDDDRLLQGTTTSPPPLMCVADKPCEGGCLISFAGWQGDGLETVGDVEGYFAKLCWEADQALGEPAACRHMLNYYDDCPRPRMLTEFLEEVELELARRAEAEK